MIIYQPETNAIDRVVWYYKKQIHYEQYSNNCWLRKQTYRFLKYDQPIDNDLTQLQSLLRDYYKYCHSCYRWTKK